LVKKVKLHGKDIIILEELPNAIVWVEMEVFKKLCEDLFPDVKANPDHKLRGKTLIQAIMQDENDELGWKKYRDGLKKIGIK